MIRLLKNPHLPEGRVTAMAIGETYRPQLEEALAERGIECYWLAPNPALDRRIAGHADLSLLHLGGECFAGAEEVPWGLPFPLNIKISTYLNDSALNLCILGDYWIGNASTAALQPAKQHIPVRQRYARCSICIVDEHSIITSDAGIARACGRWLDVLQIAPGYISLPGYDYGFLGGASFKLSKYEMAFSGRLDHHPDRTQIEAFLRERAVEPVYLTDRLCFDTGSAVLVYEEISETPPLN